METIKVKKKLAGMNWMVRKELLAQYWHMPSTVTEEGWIEFMDGLGRRVRIYGFDYDLVKEGDVLELEYIKPGITKLLDPPLKVIIDGKERYARVKIKRSHNLFKNHMGIQDEMKEKSRVVVTVLGKDRVGIVAGVSGVLAECGANIIDLTSTEMRGLFVMMMLVDMKNAKVSFEELQNRLKRKGEELGVQIMAQHEDIFYYMHRV